MTRPTKNIPIIEHMGMYAVLEYIEDEHRVVFSTGNVVRFSDKFNGIERNRHEWKAGEWPEY